MKLRPLLFVPLLPLIAVEASAQATLTWDQPNANNNWNTTDPNWAGGATFATNDNVIFNSATGETVTVQAGGVTAGTVEVGTNNGAWTFSGGSITGALTKNGAAALTLNAANSFSSIALNGGNLNLGNASGMGTGTVSMGTGVSTGTTGTSMLVTTALASGSVIATNLTLPAGDANANTNRAIYMKGTGNAAITLELSGKISGGSANARLYLNNDTSGAFNPQFIFSNDTNDFRANVWINRGGIRITSNAALGNTANTVTFDSNGGADLTFLNAMTYTRATTLSTGTDFDTGANAVTASGAINGGAYLTKIGSGTLTLSAANTYTGATTVNAGTLKVSNTLRGTASMTANTGAVLELNATNIFTTGHGAAMPATKTLTVNGGTLLMTTAFDSRFGNVNLQNGATWTSNRTLAAWDALLANTAAGAATVAVSNTAGNTTPSIMDGSGGIHLQGVQNFSVADVTTTSAADLTVSMILSDGGSAGGTGGINKTGAGTMALAAANTYTGLTTVAAGTLAFTGSGQVSGPIGVTSGAVLDLSGRSTLFGLGSGQTLTAGRAASPATDVLGNLATGAGTINILAGASTGTLTVTGDLTLNGGNIAMDLDATPAGTNDLVSVSGTLDLNAATNVSINALAGPLGNGSYVLAQAGTITGDVANVSIAGLPPSGTSRQSFTLSTTTIPNTLTLDVAGLSAALVWTGATNSTWSTDTSDENWNNLTTPDPQDQFFNLDTVTFANLLAPGPVTVDLSGPVSPGQIVVNNTLAGTEYTLNCTVAPITGSAGLLKQGTGSLTLLGLDNTFTGAVQLNGGLVTVETLANTGLPSSIGSGGSLAIDGGSLLVNDTIDNTSDRSLAIGSGGATLGVVDPARSLTLSGALTGNGDLTISGSGRVVLSGAGSRAGTTTVQAGATYEIAGSAEPGAGAFTVDGTLILNRAAATTMAQGISGTGSLVKRNTNTLTLPTANTYGGGTTINGGTILVQNAGSLGDGPIAHTGGQVRFSSGDGTTTVLDNEISLNTTGDQTFVVRSTADAAPTIPTTVRLTGQITGGAAGQTFRLVDSGTSGNHFNVLELQNAENDFQGTIEIWRGTLAITSDAALGNTENDIIHFSENLLGSIRFDADNITLSATRSIQLAANDDPINTQGFTATIPGPISGAGRFVKQGTGKLILSGTNSATGASTVAAGTLQVDGTFDTAATALTVATGATLSGNGTINRPVTVTGTIAPGASIGNLTTGATTLNGTYACEVNGATSDQITATDLTLGAASALTVADTAGVFPRVIATYSGALTGAFSSVTSGYQVDYSTPGQIILKKAGYATWAAANAGGGAADADADGDGVSNGVEYFMGETGSTFTANPPVISGQVTWPKDNTVTDASYIVQVSSDLQNWNPAPIGDVNDTGTSVIYTLPGGPGPRFVRLSVTINP